jgi:hypothetical protein
MPNRRRVRVLWGSACESERAQSGVGIRVPHMRGLLQPVERLVQEHNLVFFSLLCEAGVCAMYTSSATYFVTVMGCVVASPHCVLHGEVTDDGLIARVRPPRRARDGTRFTIIPNLWDSKRKVM